MKKAVKITMVIAALGLNSCVTLLDDEGHEGAFSPRPMFLKNIPQDESNYSMGFRDGCYNYIGQNGFGLNREYDRPVRPELITDSLYQQGYKQGDRYCGVYVNKGIIL
ncbi:MAG: hypothetical protein K0R98_411 [Rickettsiaceae bacterium]|jgi:hypothetical protein|nr:hypothetical protein [Rickettsiaceae bacterium]